MHSAFPFATCKSLQVEVVLEEGGDVGQSRADILLAVVEVHVTATRNENLGSVGVGVLDFVVDLVRLPPTVGIGSGNKEGGLSEVLVGELPGIEANEKRGG